MQAKRRTRGRYVAANASRLIRGDEFGALPSRGLIRAISQIRYSGFISAVHSGGAKGAVTVRLIDQAAPLGQPSRSILSVPQTSMLCPVLLT